MHHLMIEFIGMKQEGKNSKASIEFHYDLMTSMQIQENNISTQNKTTALQNK